MRVITKEWDTRTNALAMIERYTPLGSLWEL